MAATCERSLLVDKEAKEAFAARIFELRSKAELSRSELGRRSGGKFGQSHYSTWELGTSAPNSMYIPALAQALGVEIWELFEEPSPAAKRKWRAYIAELEQKKREQADG